MGMVSQNVVHDISVGGVKDVTEGIHPKGLKAVFELALTLSHCRW